MPPTCSWCGKELFPTFPQDLREFLAVPGLQLCTDCAHDLLGEEGDQGEPTDMERRAEGGLI